ncbi:hypothetical protein IE53DRAFT_307832, partial [Violaceomyces palustris]
KRSFKDPEERSGIYYHPTRISYASSPESKAEEIDAWSITYLPEPPSSSESESIIAYLLPQSSSSSSSSSSMASFQDSPSEYARQNPDRVRTNPVFWSRFHTILKEELVPKDPVVEFEASVRSNGWLHIYDERQPLNPGRIGTPENIIASVAFVDGELKMESYQINKSYVFLTGSDGPLQIKDEWRKVLSQKFREV